MKIQYMSDLHMELWDNSRIVSNQLRYVYYNEHMRNGFDANKVVEI